MEAYALTDVGRARKRNQDYIYSSSDPVGNLNNLFLVADGMGGHRAGDYASRFMVEGLHSYIHYHRNRPSISVLLEGIQKVNRDLYQISLEEAALSGMGTTLVAATIEGGNLYVANVGDSRLYLLKGKRLVQITRDHSYVEEMVARGQMERNSRNYLQQKNIITRALGVMDHVEVDLFERELSPGDLILMCSDGLSNMLSEDEMAHILLKGIPLKQKAEALVEQANEQGGYDNIAVIVADPQISEVKPC